jgi:hypothetical protein
MILNLRIIIIILGLSYNKTQVYFLLQGPSQQQQTNPQAQLH